MNKQPDEFLSHYLVDVGLPKTFVDELVRRSVSPDLVHEATNCKWDKEKRMVITLEDAARDKALELEAAAWYKDEFGAHMADKNKQQKKQYAAPEMLYDIDAEHSIKTLNERPGKGYGGTPGVPTFDLRSSHNTGEVVNLADGDDNAISTMSQLSSMSREELIQILCQKGKISLPGDKGSAPDSVNEPHSPSDGKSSQSSGSSSSNSSHSSVEYVSVRNAAAII